jgi:hypothetical protein
MGSKNRSTSKNSSVQFWKSSFFLLSWTVLTIASFYLGYGLFYWEESLNLKKSNVGSSILEEWKKDSLPQDLGEIIQPTTSENSETTPPEEPIRQIPVPVENESLTQTDTPKRLRASTWFSDYEAMKKFVHLYDEVHPFIYGMKGGLSNNGDLAHSWSKESKLKRVEELRSLNPNVKIIPTIFRWENPKEKIQENIGMDGRTDIRDKHIQNILYEVDTYGFDGIDIDYEGMSCNKKEAFESFIKILSGELHKRNKLLSVAVHPKTPNSNSKMVSCKGLNEPILMDFKENWRGPTTHDYATLAKYADRVKIMAYELHPRKYRNPGPGPQAPNTWLKEIIQYSKSRIPANKLYLAIPTYGYDWALNCKASATSVYHSDVQKIKSGPHKMHQPTNIPNILQSEGRSNSWTNLNKYAYVHDNKVYEDPTLWYNSNGCDRVAFFMNGKAFEEKMNLLRRYDIAGFSFWQLISDNDPEINVYLEKLVRNELPPIPKALEIEEEIAIAPKKKPVREDSLVIAKATIPSVSTKLDKLTKKQSPKKTVTTTQVIQKKVIQERIPVKESQIEAPATDLKEDIIIE